MKRPRSLRRASSLLAAVAALALVLSPGLADARAGFGGSLGSRGGRTWSAPPATNTAPSSSQPFQRSMTPNTPAAPGYGAPGTAAPGFGAPGFARPRSAFTSGLLGGLLGAGIGGMLFGHGFFGGISGGFGFIGFLLQIFLVVMIGRWLFRRFFSQRPSFAGGGGSLFSSLGGGQRGMQTPMSGGGPPRGTPAAQALAIAPADYQAFEQVLQNVQAAWSAQDLNRLRAVTTPEMLSYFAEQLAEQSSRGVRNLVTDVKLLQGDLAESWSEGARDYATVSMRYSMADVTVDASGRVVDGNPDEHTTATEIWTSVRAPGGHWLLSAIQQTR